MSKPFWLVADSEGKHFVFEYGTGNFPTGKLCIEYSAYKELEAKLANAVETLEFYAEDNNYAMSALEKIWGWKKNESRK